MAPHEVLPRFFFFPFLFLLPFPRPFTNALACAPPLQNGYTPLHQAAQQGHTHIINVLLQHGAKPNATTAVSPERVPPLRQPRLPHPSSRVLESRSFCKAILPAGEQADGWGWGPWP